MAAIVQYVRTRPIEHAPGVVAPDAPRQRLLADVPGVRVAEYELTPRAEFSATVRVLGRERYRLDMLAGIAPVDFAVGWGPMSDSRVLEEFELTQTNRFFLWETDTWPIDAATVTSHAANLHVIPANDVVAALLDRVRVGSVVTFEGRLVDVRSPNGEARTSLAREDTGAGACEILLVDNVHDAAVGRTAR